MPNHVVNEIVFQNLEPGKRAEILACILDDKGIIDFAKLLPIPLNCWMGSVGQRHEKAFKNTALDWCRENWGTKWGAYGQKPIEDVPDSLTLVFDTAWRPPYGWICALFNRFLLPFDHSWLSEGESYGHIGRFEPKFLNDFGGLAWKERDATPEEYKRLHVLRWGVESFGEETP
jgi:hypothetical protein